MHHETLETRRRLEKTPSRTRSLLSTLSISAYIRECRQRSRASREAISFREKAESCTATEGTNRGKLFLMAGQAFLNAEQTAEAIECLEGARPDIEMYSAQGSFDGLFSLGRLYQSLEYAYRQAGHSEKAGEMSELAHQLSVTAEQHFGLQTEFYPNGDRLVHSLPEAA